MPDPSPVSRRNFLGNSVAAPAAGSGGVVTAAEGTAQAASGPPANPPPPHPTGMTYGMIGKVKISRLMLGGNLVSGFMHCRDLKYVPQLFRAYVTEEKIFETFKVCEENGVNTVFESGGNFIQRYNRERGGHMQIIPSVHPAAGKSEQEIKDEVKQMVDGGVPALYVWGVACDTLVRRGPGRPDRQDRGDHQVVRAAGRRGRPLVAGADGLREGPSALRLLREDAAHRRLSDGHPRRPAEGLHVDRRRTGRF